MLQLLTMALFSIFPSFIYFMHLKKQPFIIIEVVTCIMHKINNQPSISKILKTQTPNSTSHISIILRSFLTTLVHIFSGFSFMHVYMCTNIFFSFTIMQTMANAV